MRFLILLLFVFALAPRAAEIDSVAQPEDDLLLLIVLDLAGDLSAVDVARDALITRIAQLPPSHYVGVLQAQNGLRVLAEPSADRDATAAAIRSLSVGGKAGLLNTIEKAATLGDALIERSRVRLAVLYVTDSDIRNYREAYTNPVVNGSDRGDLSRRFSGVLVRERVSRLVTSLSATQAPVFIAHLSYRSDSLNEAYQTGLLTLAQTTGGVVEFSRSLSEIPSAIDQVVDRILTHHPRPRTSPIRSQARPSP